MSPSVATLARWRAHPLAFVRECLRVEVVDDWQADVLRDLEDLDRVGSIRLAMVASKGPGKSTVDAWVCLWYLVTHPHAKGAATSITEDNLSDGLWAELSKWMARSDFLRATLEWNQRSLSVREAPATWFLSARAWPKGGSSSQQADTLAGLHADHCFFIIDEAGGVPSSVAAAADAGLANATPGSGRTALFLLSGNPTHLEGPLYDACTVDAKRWRVHRINGDPRNPKRSPRVSIEWAQGLIDRWGYDSPIVLVNVRGQFPPTQANKLLGPDDVQAAIERGLRLRPSEYLDEPKIIGVDVARYGDDASVITMRQGRAVFLPRELRNLSTTQLAHQVAALARKHKPAQVNIDVSGVGAGVYDRLEELGVPGVLPVDFGEGASEPDRFLNRRVEMWFRTAEWVRGRGTLPDVAQLRADLCAPTFVFTPDSRLKLESKEDMRKRGLPSTDYGDSLVLTHAQPFTLGEDAPAPREELERPQLGYPDDETRRPPSRGVLDPF